LLEKSFEFAAKEKLEIVIGAALPHFRERFFSPPQAAKCVRITLKRLHKLNF